MQLILARHGNTFQSNQNVVWVGSQNDLPLVDSGIDQAKHLGQMLLAARVKLDAIYAGPLQRMVSYADILLQEMQLMLKPVIDWRLNEIDYGQWSGLTSKEVQEKFGKEAFYRWESYSEWPQQSEWGESADLVTHRIRDFVDSLLAIHHHHETILLVASNGCLRYFLNLIPGALEKYIANKEVKIATGHVCKLSNQDTQWFVDAWNLSPAEFLRNTAC